MEMETEERGAVGCEGSTNGSGLGEEGRHKAPTLLLRRQSKAEGLSQTRMLLHGRCIYVSVLQAVGSRFASSCRLNVYLNHTPVS